MAKGWKFVSSRGKDCTGLVDGAVFQRTVNHPDTTQDPEKRKVRVDRTKRLNLAHKAIEKARQGR